VCCFGHQKPGSSLCPLFIVCSCFKHLCVGSSCKSNFPKSTARTGNWCRSWISSTDCSCQCRSPLLGSVSFCSSVRARSQGTRQCSPCPALCASCARHLLAPEHAWLTRLSSDSIFACCVGFVVSRCVLREHPPTHLGRGHHGILVCVLGGEIGTTAKYFGRNLRLPFTPLWSPFSVLQNQFQYFADALLWIEIINPNRNSLFWVVRCHSLIVIQKLFKSVHIYFHINPKLSCNFQKNYRSIPIHTVKGISVWADERWSGSAWSSLVLSAVFATYAENPFMLNHICYINIRAIYSSWHFSSYQLGNLTYFCVWSLHCHKETPTYTCTNLNISFDKEHFTNVNYY
jgi:hypothetical protein